MNYYLACMLFGFLIGWLYTTIVIIHSSRVRFTVPLRFSFAVFGLILGWLYAFIQTAEIALSKGI